MGNQNCRQHKYSLDAADKSRRRSVDNLAEVSPLIIWTSVRSCESVPAWISLLAQDKGNKGKRPFRDASRKVQNVVSCRDLWDNNPIVAALMSGTPETTRRKPPRTCEVAADLAPFYDLSSNFSSGKVVFPSTDLNIKLFQENIWAEQVYRKNI